MTRPMREAIESLFGGREGVGVDRTQRETFFRRLAAGDLPHEAVLRQEQASDIAGALPTVVGGLGTFRIPWRKGHAQDWVTQDHENAGRGLGVCLATRCLVLALGAGDSDAVDTALWALTELSQPPAASPAVTRPSAPTDAQAAFEAIRALPPTSWRQAALHLAAEMLGEEPPRHADSIRMRIVGTLSASVAAGTSENRTGYSGVLTLYRFPDPDLDGVCLFPYPGMLPIPTDEDLRNSLKPGFFSSLKGADGIGGWIGWRLEKDYGGAFRGLTGPSLGAAVAVGVRFLLRPDERVEDLAIAVSASVGEDGSLLRAVGGVTEKIDAARAGRGKAGPIRHLLFAETEGNRGDGNLTIEQVSSLDGVVDYFRRNNRARLAVLERLEEAHGRIRLIGRDEKRLRDHPNLYLPLPLLQEIRIEDLPRKNPDGPRDDAKGTSDGNRTDSAPDARRDLPPGEWTLGNLKAVTDSAAPPRPVEALFQDWSGSGPARFVVLGAPGSGKTTLVRYLALAATSLAERLVPPERRDFLVRRGRPLLPAYVRLADWSEKKTDEGAWPSLPEYLAVAYPLPEGNAEDTWREWLQRGEVLLLLDGLDEVSRDAAFLNDALKPVVDPESMLLGGCPLALTCRLVSRETLGVLGLATEPTLRGQEPPTNAYPIFRPGGLTPALRLRFLDAYFSAGSDAERENRQRTEDALTGGAFRMLADSPLLLSLACYVGASPEVATLPATRTELYEVALSLLLGQIGVSVTQRDVLRRALEQLALRMMLNGVEEPHEGQTRQRLSPTIYINGEEAERHLTTVYGTLKDWNLLFGDGIAQPEALRMLVQEARILEYGPEKESSHEYAKGSSHGHASGLVFLHLTFQEYLAACGLTARAECGWREELSHGPHYGKVDRGLLGWDAIRTTVDRISWSPNFQEVIFFLAGRLGLEASRDDDRRRESLAVRRQTLAEMVRHLGARENNDLFEQRLILVTLCLPEILNVTGLGVAVDPS